MYGSDQAASIEAKNIKQLAETLRKVLPILGDGKKSIREEEKEAREKLRISKD